LKGGVFCFLGMLKLLLRYGQKRFLCFFLFCFEVKEKILFSERNIFCLKHTFSFEDKVIPLLRKKIAFYCYKNIFSRSWNTFSWVSQPIANVMLFKVSVVVIQNPIKFRGLNLISRNVRSFPNTRQHLGAAAAADWQVRRQVRGRCGGRCGGSCVQGRKAGLFASLGTSSICQMRMSHRETWTKQRQAISKPYDLSIRLLSKCFK